MSGQQATLLLAEGEKSGNFLKPTLLYVQLVDNIVPRSSFVGYQSSVASIICIEEDLMFLIVIIDNRIKLLQFKYLCKIE